MTTSRRTVLFNNIALALAAVLTLAPLAWMALAALSDPATVFAPVTERDYGLESIEQAATSVPLGRYYLTSFGVTAAILLGQFALCLPAGYALARLEFRGRRTMFWLVVVGLVLPLQAVALPSYLLLGQLGWLDTPAALIVPHLASPFAVFLFRQYILSIPQAVLDAARIDGVGPIRVVTRVVLPLAVPALVAHGVFSAVFHWNDLFWPSLVLRTDRFATVPYAVSRFAATGQEGLQYGPQMAAGLLATLPLLIGFVIAQRLFVAGVADGAAR